MTTTTERNGTGVDLEAATAHAYAMCAALGLLVDGQEDTADTPRRLARALAEMTSGAGLDASRHLARTFPPKAHDPGMIVVPGIEVVSLCEHHLLPFTGTVCVAYIPAPDARIVGLSKMARMVTEYAARPQVQERLGEQIVSAMTSRLDVLGAACVVDSVHACMTMRGVRAAGASMVTSHLAGVFKDDPTVRAEFMSIARG